MRIEFDPKKAANKLKKHSVSFEEAASCLLDRHARALSDPDALNESRQILLGMSHVGRLLAVCDTLRGDEVIRLISARKATRKEVMTYA